MPKDKALPTKHLSRTLSPSHPPDFTKEVLEMCKHCLRTSERKTMRDCHSCRDCEAKSICSACEIEEGGTTLVECLRGMLLAERQASKAAKQDAELLTKKVMELEIILNQEIKLRDQSERKLHFLQRKLEAFSTKTAC